MNPEQEGITEKNNLPFIAITATILLAIVVLLLISFTTGGTEDTDSSNTEVAEEVEFVTLSLDEYLSEEYQYRVAIDATDENIYEIANEGMSVTFNGRESIVFEAECLDGPLEIAWEISEPTLSNEVSIGSASFVDIPETNCEEGTLMSDIILGRASELEEYSFNVTFGEESIRLSLKYSDGTQILFLTE